MGFVIYRIVKFRRENFRYDTPYTGLLITLFFHSGGILFETLHLIFYSYNGRGVPIFDIFSLIGVMLAEIAMSSLLMTIASGWTLNYQDIDWDNNLEIYLPVGAILVIFHLIIAALTYVDIDASHKYHDYAGI
jgi:hypothetical protein